MCTKIMYKDALFKKLNIYQQRVGSTIVEFNYTKCIYLLSKYLLSAWYCSRCWEYNERERRENMTE